MSESKVIIPLHTNLVTTATYNSIVTHAPYHSSTASLPREKIFAGGVTGLTTEELLATILCTGQKHIPLATLAARVTAYLRQHKEPKVTELLKIKGVGLAKACQVVAAIELVERFRPRGFPTLNSLTSVLPHLSELRFFPREHVVCLYLNARMQLILKETLAIGSTSQAVLAPKDIFAVIKYHPVSYLILAHNHPSGTTTPSAEDLRFTTAVVQAGQILGVELLDHIIITPNEHYSLQAAGKLSRPIQSLA